MVTLPGPAEGASDPVAVATGVGRRYPGVVALDGVDLSLYPGEVLALCGANGAGKSTFARLLSGQEQPSTGEIRLEGSDHAVRSQNDAFSSGVLLLHQEPLIIEDFTVGENVWLFSLRSGGSAALAPGRSTDDDETRAALSEVGMANVPASRLAGTLTPGQRQMLALTRAVVNPHRILILDETTASTTESYFELVKEMVAREKAKGVSVVFVSHRMQEVFDIADRIAVLRNGALVDVVRAGDTDAEGITQLMIGDALKVLHRPPHEAPAGTDSGPGLEIEGLTAGSARDVSFAVQAGEIVGLYGLVGSGRSSVARAVTGQLPIVSGGVRIGGRTPDLRSPKTGLASGIAYVSEDRRREGFIPDFTNGENLTLASLKSFARFSFLRLGQLRQAATDLVSRFGVKGTPGVLTTTLSGGNQQKVVIAKWVAADPEVIVFDEPTKGIDVGARANIYEIIYGLAAAGKTVLVVSSEAEEILLLTHRVLVMRDGAVVAELDSRAADTDDLARPALGAVAA